MKLKHNTMETITMKLTKRSAMIVLLVSLLVIVTLLVGALPVIAADSPMLHNSNRFPATTKHGGAWGLPGTKYGEFACNTCHAKNTGNIKRVLKTFTAPNGVDQFPIEADPTPPAGGVNFQDAREGSSDFGDDARVPNNESTNVCEVCHTYDPAQLVGVKFHGYDMSGPGDSGHYNKADCMICHPHNQGFKPQACDSCHGYPPTTTGAGGPTGLSNAPHTTGSTTAGSHQKHAVDLGYACTNCHDNYNMPQVSTVNSPFGDISIGFNNFGSTTGSYTGQAGLSYNDVLGTGGEDCSNVYCHSNGQSADGTSATPSAYSTASWSTPASGACGTCHSETDPATGAHTKHMAEVGVDCDTCHLGNSHVDRNIDVTSGTYTADGAPGNGYGSCSTASCHDQGRGGLGTTPLWGASVTDCSECHASAPTTGGHSVHLGASIAGAAISCADCHDAFTDPSTETAPQVGHRDSNIDVTVGSYPADKAKDSAFTNCTTASCHQTGQSTNDYTATSAWDADDANCTQCHAAVPATGSHATHVTTAGYDCSQCHTNATKDTSYNDANHGDVTIDVAVGNYITNRGDAAYGTAFTTCDTIACHGDGLNAGGGNTPVWGTSAGCAACHDTVNDGTGSHAIHLTYTGNSCVACHDNADVAGTAPGQHGDGDVDVYNSAVLDLGYPADAAIGNASWTSCTAASCHDDGRSANTTPNWGTAAADACAACHDAIPATGSHVSHVADATVACTDCHAGAVQGTTRPTAGHDNGSIDTTAAHGYNANPDLGGAFDTCSTASCHNTGRNAGLTGVWGTTLNSCSECHETSPTTFAHNAHLTASISPAIACNDCHAGATEGTTAGAGHRDGNIDTVAGLGYTADKGLGTATTTCGTSYCHGDNMPLGTASGTTNAPNWNAASTGCNFCHDMAPAAIGAHAGKTATDCITCHNHANAAGNGFTDASLHLNGVVENDADSCTACHAGDIDGAKTGVHGSHTDTASYLAGKTVSGGDYGGAGWYTTSYINGQPNFGCGECHPAAEGVAHPAAGLNIDLDPAGETPTVGSLKLKNVDGPTNPTFSTGSSVTCDNIYCHSDAGATPAYATTPNWYGGTVSGNCTDCHANGPSSGTHANHIVGIHYETLYDGAAGLMAASGTAGSGAAHGDAATADSISCQTCHNDTVAVEVNDQNAVCNSCHDGGVTAPVGNMTISTAGSTHVNGTADVVFDNLASFKSKAQVRDDITTVAELNANWTRNGGYKAAASFDQGKVATPSYAGGSCSNVSCHNGIATPTWSTGFNGDCRACHTTLP